jgi:phosphoribosylformimino-5-aminoimidazole carboxamide ribotide isomerase
LGGGIRNLQTIEDWLRRGVRRVILGTVALHQPELVKEACRLFPGQIAVSIDAREGFVAVAGWAESSTVRALDLALRYEDSGVSAIVYTDINRDGAMGGVNVEATADLAFALTTPVIASGGVSSIADLRALKAEEHTGIDGVIVGRALYDGRIDPQEALALLLRGSDAALTEAPEC